MNITDWFWLTIIILIIVIGTNDALCCYWKCRYSQNKLENKEHKSIKPIIGFTNKKQEISHAQ